MDPPPPLFCYIFCFTDVHVIVRGHEDCDRQLFFVYWLNDKFGLKLHQYVYYSTATYCLALNLLRWLTLIFKSNGKVLTKISSLHNWVHLKDSIYTSFFFKLQLIHCFLSKVVIFGVHVIACLCTFDTIHQLFRMFKTKQP